MKWETIWPNTAKDLVAKISGLHTLSPGDREKLIRHNFPAIQILLQVPISEYQLRAVLPDGLFSNQKFQFW
jgi:hypothetical protein